jgi:hypothetical protein
VSAEAYGSWNKKKAFKAKVMPKSKEVKEELASRLRGVLILKDLDDTAF